MAYIKRCKWDLFISYPMEAVSWVEQFQKDLQNKTLLSGAAGLKIYFAQRDWRPTETSKDMLDAAQNSALFISVLTKDSLVEDRVRFLQLEMAAFRQATPVLRGRFCPIPLYPITGAQLVKAMPIEDPDAFWNANEEFFFYDKGSPLWLEPGLEPQPGDYLKAVKRVAHQLRERLDEIRSLGEGVFSGRTVLLAPIDSESHVEREWQSIKSLLVNDGATVISVETSERDPAKLQAELDAAIQRADLLVQLFSTRDDSFDQAKALLEAVEARKPDRILQWRKKRSDPNSDLDTLKKLNEGDRNFCEGANVQTGPLEDFKVAIRSKLEEINKAARRKTIKELDKLEKLESLEEGSTPLPERPYIYIAADTADLDLASQLQEVARERTTADVMDRDETKRFEDFEQGLMLASGVIFLHGNASQVFVENWLKVFARKTSLLKLQSKLAEKTWLYEAPPQETKGNKLLAPIKLRIEGSRERFTLEGINKICAELCGDRC
jgi:hypothetical protein